MRNLLAFRDENDEAFPTCPCRDSIRDVLWQFHKNLLNHCSMPTSIDEGTETAEPEEKEPPSPTVSCFPFPSGPAVINLFACSAQLSMKFFLPINVKMPTIVGILTFMSRKTNILGLSEPKKC